MTYIPEIPLRDLIEIEFKEHKVKLSTRQLTKKCKESNLFKTKSVITFNTTSGILKIKTTIWMVGKKYILLKENLYIPIKSIVSVE